MSKEIAFQHRDRFIQLGIAVAVLRRMKGISQEMLAEKANISRGLLSAIEAPGIVKSFSLEVFFSLADALDISPTELIQYADAPEQIPYKRQ